MIKWGGFPCRAAGILLLAAGLGAQVFPQQTDDPFNAGPAPDIVRQPRQGEAPRYPLDTVIGELGRGRAPENAWLQAQNVMDALIRGNRTAAALAAGGESLAERLFSELEAVNPDKYRLGGGKVEADGSVSFLVRFLGRDQSMAGELYLVMEGGAVVVESPVPAEGAADEEAVPADVPVSVGQRWRLDDLILEEAKDLTTVGDSYQYDFSPYERFY